MIESIFTISGSINMMFQNDKFFHRYNAIKPTQLRPFKQMDSEILSQFHNNLQKASFFSEISLERYSEAT
jgi:hypothetical protein